MPMKKVVTPVAVDCVNFVARPFCNRIREMYALGDIKLSHWSPMVPSELCCIAPPPKKKSYDLSKLINGHRIPSKITVTSSVCGLGRTEAEDCPSRKISHRLKLDHESRDHPGPMERKVRPEESGLRKNSILDRITTSKSMTRSESSTFHWWLRWWLPERLLRRWLRDCCSSRITGSTVFRASKARPSPWELQCSIERINPTFQNKSLGTSVS